MKIKGYLALFLIVLMAVSILSSASIVSAQPHTDAKKSHSYRAINVRYQTGKSYTFKPWQNSLTDSWFGGDAGGPVGTPQHSEFVKKDTLFSSVTTKGEESGLSFAAIFYLWNLHNLRSADLGKPCTIAVTVSYTLYAKCKDQGTGGAVSTIGVDASTPSASQYVGDSVSGTDPASAKTVTKTFTLTGTVQDFFTEGATHGTPTYTAWTQISVSSDSYTNALYDFFPQSHLSARAEVSSVTLSF